MVGVYWWWVGLVLWRCKVDAAALVLMGTTAQADWLVKNVNQNIPTGTLTIHSHPEVNEKRF